MSTGTIVCVDDDVTVLSALRPLLNKALGGGIIVELAESGQEALEICADLHAMGRPVSVAISDFIMPGMRGDEFLVRLHQLSPLTVNILLTGQSDLQGVKRTINEANLYRFLEKPFINDDMVLTVKAALRAFSRDRELGMQIEYLIKSKSELENQVGAQAGEITELKAQLARQASSASQ
jgi:DNA-binding NtrC family response regulator